MLTSRYTTAQWLIGYNDSVRRGIQRLYPDLGHGGPPGAEVDRTVVVQQDYPPCTNCDGDATQVILQFWRAHAGFRSLWR